MPKRKATVLEAIYVSCPNCLKVNGVFPDKFTISPSGISDCDMCGSHGAIEIWLDKVCEGCGKKIPEFEVDSW